MNLRNIRWPNIRWPRLDSLPKAVGIFVLVCVIGGGIAVGPPLLFSKETPSTSTSHSISTLPPPECHHHAHRDQGGNWQCDPPPPPPPPPPPVTWHTDIIGPENDPAAKIVVESPPPPPVEKPTWANHAWVRCWNGGVSIVDGPVDNWSLAQNGNLEWLSGKISSFTKNPSCIISNPSVFKDLQ